LQCTLIIEVLTTTKIQTLLYEVIVMNALALFSNELLKRIRESHYDRVDDAVFDDYMINVHRATSALIDVGVDDDKIIQLLQKYWDLRRSEATDIVAKR